MIAEARSWHASERTKVISKRLARPVNAGLRDSYRAVHPDPVTIPGFTWTPGGPEGDPHEVHDRIDWVLSAGPSTALESTVVGEASGPDVGIGFDPWPTDHRGVVSTFRVTPTLPSPSWRHRPGECSSATRWPFDIGRRRRPGRP